MSYAVDRSLTAEQQSFLDDFVEGLNRTPKNIACKYFYDQKGSKLFDQICELPEYYLTRTEQGIMDASASEMAEQLGERVLLVEFGSGSSLKTRVLLDNLVDPAAYVPLDISEEHLLQTAKELQEAYAELEILPLVADFTESFELPAPSKQMSHAAVYFPGSTIGNFTRPAAEHLLDSIADILGDHGGLLIGIDLKKDVSVIEAAYNDAEGVTDKFNLNVLRRANRELGTDFDLCDFRHVAYYNPDHGRIEIYIESQADQVVSVGDVDFDFAKGERILTEYSHKYTIDEFATLAARVGYQLKKSWTDDNELFAVLYLEVED